MPAKKSNRLPNVHPGEVLLEDFLKPMGISQYRLAKELAVSESTISDLARGRRSLTADMALRLAKFFAVTPQFWLNLQEMYDLEEAEHKLHNTISRIRPHRVAA
jgi:addiction module HigA family antidote